MSNLKSKLIFAIFSMSVLFIFAGRCLCAQENAKPGVSSAAVSSPADTASNVSSVTPASAVATASNLNNPQTPAVKSDEDDMKEKLAKKISLDLRDMNIIDVLKFLAIKGSFNIVTSKNIEGRVTLLLNNVAIQDALDIILIANDLAYMQKTKIIYVMTGAEYLAMFGKKFSENTKVKIIYLKYARPSYVLSALQNIRSTLGKIIIDEDSGTVVMIDTEDKLKEMSKALDEMEHKTETRVITLQYAKADAMAAQLKSKLTDKAVGSIQFDERSNQIIITGLPDRLADVEKIIKALDTRTKAVLLEVSILQVTLKPQYDMGINWELAFQGSKSSILRSLDFQGAFPISDTNIASTFGKIAVGNLSANDITVAVTALKQVSTTKLLANPRIMALNRQEAVINIGDTIPYVLTTTTGTGDTATTSETVNFINVGLKLVVTPTISDNGLVAIKIKPEISSRTGTVTTPKKAEIPVVSSTVVDTTVLARDGNTIIIGGLVKNDKLAIKKGIAGLMDLPLVGGLFSNRADSITNTEIVIFITPHIVDGETLIPPSKDEILGMKQAQEETKEEGQTK